MAAAVVCARGDEGGQATALQTHSERRDEEEERASVEGRTDKLGVQGVEWLRS